MDKNREMLLLRLERLFDAGQADPAGLTSMSDMCRSELGVRPYELDEILLEELGVTGEEFFAVYGRKVVDIGNKFY